MLTEFDSFVKFKQAQNRFSGRPYRLPKDWETYFAKLPEKNKEILVLITKYFNTKWSNINIDLFFDVGFELFKQSFFYHRFFDERIVKLYIVRDKVKKREAYNVREDLKHSLEHATSVCNNIHAYVEPVNGSISRPVQDYIANKIGKYFFTWLIDKARIKLNTTEKMMLQSFVDNYREYLFELNAVLKGDSK